MTAPPRIAMMRREDAWLFKEPNPSTAREKMFENITEQKSPTASTVHIAACPDVTVQVMRSPTMMVPKMANERGALAPLTKNATTRSTR